MILMAEAELRQSNMRSEGFFFRGRGQYTIFFALPARESQFSFSAAARKLALSGRSTKKYIFAPAGLYKNVNFRER